MTKDVFIKGNTIKPVPVQINKGLVLERNTKRVTNLSKNEKVYEQGDGIMKIAPFDNYYMFTIYSELNLENVPVDLHNMGSFFLTFKDKSSEVKIENFKNTKDVNPALGQILFRISQEEAEKILSLDTNIFYVTSFLRDENSKSDETVIYSGRFAEYNEANLNSLTDEIERLKNELNATKTEKLKNETELNSKITELSDSLVKLRNEYASVQEDLNNYKNLYTEVCKNIKENTKKVKEQSNQQIVKDIDKKLQCYKLIDAAKANDKNRILKENALNSLKQNIIGIKSTVTDIKTMKPAVKLASEKITVRDAKLSLANIVVKTGVVLIYAFMYTKYADLDTEYEMTQYNALNDLYKSTQDLVNENKYNNIEYNIVYTEKDYGQLIGKYNVNSNCIVVTKNGATIGKINVNASSTAINIIQQIETIINQNNN